MFKSYYDFVFDSDNASFASFENDYDSIFTSENTIQDFYQNFDSKWETWYNTQLNELEKFTNQLLMFQKVLDNCIQDFEWDPPEAFYAQYNENKTDEISKGSRNGPKSVFPRFSTSPI